MKNLPNNYKRNKQFENPFNKTNRNVVQFINKNKQVSTQDLNDLYLTNSNINDNYHHIKSNISDTLIKNPLDIKNRRTIENNNSQRVQANPENKVIVIFNNNKYFNNNRNVKINA